MKAFQASVFTCKEMAADCFYISSNVVLIFFFFLSLRCYFCWTKHVLSVSLIRITCVLGLVQ